MPSRIVLFEDSDIDAAVVDALLRDWITQKQGSLQRYRSLAELDIRPPAIPPDVALIDLNILDSSGLDTFLEVRRRIPDVAMVVLSGLADFDVAVSAVREGASDYIVKQSLSAELLLRTCRFAYERNCRRLAEKRLGAATLELQIAHDIQSRMIPYRLPHVPGLELAGGTRAASLGSGDYFDVLPLPDGTLLIAMGDVSGHGIGPALVMVEIRACIRALLRCGRSLRETMIALSFALREDLTPTTFSTLFVAVLNPATGRMENAGFGAGAFIHRNDGQWEYLAPDQPVLTSWSQSDCVIHETRLGVGETLVAFTDGVSCIEPREGAHLGESAILDRIAADRDAPLHAVWRNLCREISQKRSGPADDSSGVLVRRVEMETTELPNCA
jgi:phosphoserine phosphatase RsbU/P